jgi:peptidoglycan pentaglycine glycine transferase (the first glycine)
MVMKKIDKPVDAETWNAAISSLPNAHILQTWQWAQVKSRFNWNPLPTLWHDRQGEVAAAAMAMTRSMAVRGLPFNLKMMYVPKGPLLCDWQDANLRQQVFKDLRALAAREGAIFVKIDPDVRIGTGAPGDPDASGEHLGESIITELEDGGWSFSAEQVQFRNTVLLDLTKELDELLAAMKQKTRYNIRLAQKKGVTVRAGSQADLDLLFEMYRETSSRDGFVIRQRGYYLDVWETFMQAGMVEPLIAEVMGEAVAGLLLFRFSRRAWYLYGMSRDLHREKMANYLLQWEAIQRAKASGCLTYDLWGAPDEFTNDDPLWGVYRFKEGLGGTVVRHIGAWDLPVRHLVYSLYTIVLPRYLAFMRRRGMEQAKAGVSSF